jgi:Zn-dependent protease
MGPIGIISGKAVSSSLLHGYPPGGQVLLLLYIFSLSLGSFNLIPVSFLDGGRIFRTLFSRFPRFIRIWDQGITIFLVVLVLYLIGGDIFKIFLK